MSKKLPFFTILMLLTVLAAVGCASAKHIPEGQYILKNNKVKILNSDGYTGSDLKKYLKQNDKENNIFGLKAIFKDPVLYDETMVEPSKVALKNHLQYLGYYDSKIDTTSVANKNKIKVTYLVTLGKKYPIDSVKYIVENKDIREIFDKYPEDFTIKKGDILNEASLEAESEVLAKRLRNNGYFNFNRNYFFFSADTSTHKNVASLVVELKDYTRNETPEQAVPHRKFKIGKVEIEPQEGFTVRPDFLTDMNRITTGMDYSEEAINTTYQRFSGNRAFNSVNLQLTQVDTNTVDCNIRLTGSKLQGMRLNLEASVNASALIGISPSISYTHKNLFHGGEYFTLGFRGNFQFMAKQPIRSNEFAVNASISLPKFLLLPSRLFNGPRVPTTDISASFNYQSRPEYKRQMISGSYGYSWSSSDNLRWQVLPVQLNIVRMNDVDTAFFNHLGSTYLQNLYTNHFDLGAGVITYYSTSQETNPDYTYFYLRFQGDISGNLLSLLARKRKEETGQKTIWGIPYSQYVRAEISAVQTWRFGKDDKFALAGRLLAGVGYAYGNSKIMPLEKSFFAGGASSLRGWQTRTIGPGNAPIDKNFAIANQTGEMRLEANLEFRFPIVGGFGGAVFVDAGNVWNLPKKGITPDLGTFSFASFGKSIAMDWGLGARYDFGMILVRVDLGVKGYDPVTLQWLTPDLWKSRGWKGMCALHFGVGYPF